MILQLKMEYLQLEYLQLKMDIGHPKHVLQT